MSLLPNDLEGFVNEIFTIDSYKSKMGQDSEVSVLAFEVQDKQPAKDLMNFIEKGYDFVLDSDVSSGENAKGKYQVFVELERNRRLPERIATILEDLSKLTGNDEWRFRYYKGVESTAFDESVASNVIPLNKDTYEGMINEYQQQELDRFFNRGVTEQKWINNDTIEFSKHVAGNIKMKVVDEGTTQEMVLKYPGAIKLGEDSMSENLFLTKYFGNYNIYKIDNNLFFTNGVRTKVMQRV
jgi:hypothetical protein